MCTAPRQHARSRANSQATNQSFNHPVSQSVNQFNPDRCVYISLLFSFHVLKFLFALPLFFFPLFFNSFLLSLFLVTSSLLSLTSPLLVPLSLSFHSSSSTSLPLLPLHTLSLSRSLSHLHLHTHSYPPNPFVLTLLNDSPLSLSLPINLHPQTYNYLLQIHIHTRLPSSIPPPLTPLRSTRLHRFLDRCRKARFFLFLSSPLYSPVRNFPSCPSTLPTVPLDGSPFRHQPCHIPHIFNTAISSSLSSNPPPLFLTHSLTAWPISKTADQ